MDFLNKIFLLLLLLHTGLIVKAQDVDYARYCLEKLSSKSFHGRGYVKGGDLKAAKFISEEFEKNDLKYFHENYYQSYDFPINTFPGRLKIVLDEENLVAGEDYVIGSSNKSTNGIFKLVYVSDSITTDSAFLEYIFEQKLTNNEVVVTSAKLRGIYGMSLKGIKGVIVTIDKPWWHVSRSTTLSSTFWLRVKTEKFDSKPNSVTVKFENEFVNSHKTQNVVAYIEGKKYPEKYFVFTSHYDHLGMMGNKTYFPGANDNASGTSMLMDLARHFSLSGNQPDFSIVFMAFSGEEAGLYGSRFNADNPLFPLENIELLINLDMVGSGSDGITVVNSSIYSDLLEKMRRINKENRFLKQIKERGESCNSDHCPFFQKGVKSVFIYTMGKELVEYHTVYDTPENFPFTAYDGLFKLLTEIVRNPVEN